MISDQRDNSASLQGAFGQSRGHAQNSNAHLQVELGSLHRPAPEQFRPGVLTSVATLKRAALDYLDVSNDAESLMWSVDTDTSLGRVAGHRAVVSRSGR